VNFWRAKGGARGEGLGGPDLFERHIGSRYGALFNGPEGFAGFAVKTRRSPVFARPGRLHPPAAVVAHGGGVWERVALVVIPDVVVHHLEVPEALAVRALRARRESPKRFCPARSAP